jgi:hypothetical protein
MMRTSVTTSVACAMAIALSSGCDQTFRGGAFFAPFGAAKQQPASAVEADPSSVESETQMTDGTVADPERVAEARDQVLAFIHRLEPGDEELEAPHDEEPESPSESSPAPPREVAEIMESVTKPDPHAADTAHQDHPGHSQDEPAVANASPADVESEPSTAATEDVASEAKRPRVVTVSIRRPATLEPITTTEAARGNDATEVSNRPVMSLDEESHNAHATIARLEQRIENSPNDIDARWRLALMHIAEHDESHAVEVVGEMSGGSAEVLGRAIRAVGDVGRALSDPVAGAGDALDSVDRLQFVLRDLAPLKIPAVAMCSRVQAFGVYEELPAGVFRPFTANQAIVYVEIANFQSDPMGDGRFKTSLRDHLEIMTADGVVVWRHDEPRIEDIARRRRQDFFIAQRISMPPTLANGHYVLKVTVDDLLANKRTQAIHPFTIGPVRGGSSTP